MPDQKERRPNKPSSEWTDEEIRELDDFLRAIGWGLPAEEDDHA